jgi:hypothetical protein
LTRMDAYGRRWAPGRAAELEFYRRSHHHASP